MSGESVAGVGGEAGSGGEAVAPAPSRAGRLARSGAAWTGGVIVLFWVACALFGPHLVPCDPYAEDLLGELAPPSRAHPFGTDQIGRDILSRVLVGSRDILTVAPVATVLGTAAGTLLGLVAGMAGGVADAVIGRAFEVVMALPLLVLALLALAALGPSDATVVAVIALAFAPLVGRTVRAAVRAERELDYVAAAELRGQGRVSIMLVEVLPNVAAPILVEATVRLGYAIFAVASLSFLGFGIQPPSADWGLAIAENYGVIGGGYWWTVLFDAGATASLVVGVNLLAEGIAEALAA